MTGSRLQHLAPAGAILALAALVAWISFTQEPADAFTFPRVVSSVMFVLAIWNAARAILGLSKVGSGLTLNTLKTVAPGLLLMLVYVFSAAKGLGFYVSSLIAFLALYSLYDPASHKEAKTWVKRGAVSLAFMVVIYGLFALLLRVQTPRGFFF